MFRGMSGARALAVFPSQSRILELRIQVVAPALRICRDCSKLRLYKRQYVHWYYLQRRQRELPLRLLDLNDG